jgi:hypothetical protein
VPLLPVRDGPIVLHADVPAGEAADAHALTAAALRLASSGRADVLKDAPDASVIAGEALGLPVVVKTTRSPAKLRRLFEGLGFGAAKPTRHVRGAARLRAAGIPTARVYTLLRGSNPAGEPVDTLVMERLAGRDALRTYAAADARTRRRIAQGVGLVTRSLVEVGLHNRDHKPSNLIVLDNSAADPDAPVRISLVDPVGVRRGKPNVPRLLFNLYVECVGAGVSVPRTDRLRVLLAAAGMRDEAGDRPDRPAKRRRGDRTTRDIIWTVAARLLERHGDPTPEDNPLA